MIPPASIDKKIFFANLLIIANKQNLILNTTIKYYPLGKILKLE